MHFLQPAIKAAQQIQIAESYAAAAFTFAMGSLFTSSVLPEVFIMIPPFKFKAKGSITKHFVIV